MVLKKFTRRVKTLITKKKKRQPHKIPTLSSPSPPQSPPPPPIAMPKKNFPFLFPPSHSTVLPDPSPHFSPSLLSSPLPTNSFFQNFVLKNGDVQEYIHPYLVKPSSSSLCLCHPNLRTNSAFLYEEFQLDWTISASNKASPDGQGSRVISSFNDLSVTLEYPDSNLRFFLVRGSPYLTFAVGNSTPLAFSTIHAILSFSCNSSKTRYVAKLNNGQTWLFYSSSAIDLRNEMSFITSSGYSGVIRIAILPDSDDKYESVLDRFATCYPVSGEAVLSMPFQVEYKWEKRGWGDLLMLAHPYHVGLLSDQAGSCSVIKDLRYHSIDGELVGVVGDSWMLKSNPISVTWHSIKGVEEGAVAEVVAALSRDVESLTSTPISTTSSYFYGKLLARAARLALIAEEVCFVEVIPAIRKYLKDNIEPWLEGTFNGNGFLYDKKWGGIVTVQGSQDSGADFGFGVYNDHHYHLGYFLYAIAVLAKIDPGWGRKYRPQAYSLMADFMNLGKRSSSLYPRLRCFDLWKLHSWAGGLTEFADGRNQESTSEAVNAYYSAALMGLAYGDTHLVAIGSTLAALEIGAAQMWWHVREGDNMYGVDFTRENRVVGVLWSTKRDGGLWFAPPDWKECRLGIQVLPLLPITELLFTDASFVRQLVNWTMPALGRGGVGEGWKGFVYALEGVYDKESALNKIRSLNGFDDGNSLTNLLWWIHSRGDDFDHGCEGGGRFCWFGHYCH